MTSDVTLLIVTTSFPTSNDGSEAAGSFVLDLAIELEKHAKIWVVAPGPKSLRENWNQSIEVFRYRAPEVPLSTLKLWRPKDVIEILKVLRSGEAATTNAAKAGSIVHILALWALPSGHWARRVSRKLGIPYSVWTLGSDIWTLGQVPLLRNYLYAVLRDAKQCYSDGLQLAEDTAAIGRRNVEFLPSTRRIERKRELATRTLPPYRLVFIGRWHMNKGIDLLLDALGLLRDTDWANISGIEIYGGGTMEPEVKTGVARLQRENRPVQLGGFLSKEEATNAILAADWLLIPSRIESIPVIFSDAMKLSCPVIAMPVGDLPALLNECEIGVLATEVNAIAYANAIRNAINSGHVHRIDALRKTAQRFELSEIAINLAKALIHEHTQ